MIAEKFGTHERRKSEQAPNTQYATFRASPASEVLHFSDATCEHPTVGHFILGGYLFSLYHSR